MLEEVLEGVLEGDNVTSLVQKAAQKVKFRDEAELYGGIVINDDKEPEYEEGSGSGEGEEDEEGEEEGEQEDEKEDQKEDEKDDEKEDEKEKKELQEEDGEEKASQEVDGEKAPQEDLKVDEKSQEETPGDVKEEELNNNGENDDSKGSDAAIATATEVPVAEGIPLSSPWLLLFIPPPLSYLSPFFFN